MAVASLAGLSLGPHAFYLGEAAPLPIPWVVFVPLLDSYIVAACVISPLPRMELLAQRRLAILSHAYLASVVIVATLLVWLATSRTPPPISSMSAIRNFLGLLGLSLISIALFGAALAWMLPCGIVFTAIAIRNGDDGFLALDWLLAPDTDKEALMIAGILLAVGIVATRTRAFLLRDASVE
jgi:hypothetical protein